MNVPASPETTPTPATSASTKVLYVCHNHPSVRPGGAEAYAVELYQAMRRTERFTPVLVAKGDRPAGEVGPIDHGTRFQPVGGDGDQYLFDTDGYEFDWLRGTMADKGLYTEHFRRFLRAVQPDVVHFQHTLFLGYELIREVRTSLPRAPIVYTLHEYLPICHNDGQMVRTASAGGGPCERATPLRCHECFPAVPASEFFRRSRFIQAQLQLVDLFLAPSDFLRRRFVEWGIPEHKIRVEEYGRLPPDQVAPTQDRSCRDRFAFFGQLNPYKGVEVLLEAMLLVEAYGRAPNRASRSTPRLTVHGANLHLQGGRFRDRVRELLDQASSCVDFAGPYDHRDLPELMAPVDWVVVPSVWWENSPLVIQEAFAHGRPVICSDLGGMAEKVTHGVNGIRFRAGDPCALAAALRTAAEDPTLWATLRKGIPGVYDMAHHVAALTQVYDTLLARSARCPR